MGNNKRFVEKYKAYDAMHYVDNWKKITKEYTWWGFVRNHSNYCVYYKVLKNKTANVLLIKQNQEKKPILTKKFKVDFFDKEAPSREMLRYHSRIEEEIKLIKCAEAI